VEGVIGVNPLGVGGGVLMKPYIFVSTLAVYFFISFDVLNIACLWHWLIFVMNCWASCLCRL
jgi:hypothetical protein